MVAINDPFIDVEYMAYMIKYDSVHGRFEGEVSADPANNTLTINGKQIKVYDKMNPEEIPWAEAGAEYIAEATGIFVNTEKASLHLKGGAQEGHHHRPRQGQGNPHVRHGRQPQDLQQGHGHCVQRLLHHQLPGPPWPR